MSNDKTKLILANTNEQGTDALNIQSLIYVFRDKQVMLDSDLAYLYKVETGYLNRAVKRNISRFLLLRCFLSEGFVQCLRGAAGVQVAEVELFIRSGK